MASIKNVSLKGFKSGIGHDKAGFQANIYVGTKKIGSVLDDGYGGGLQIHIEKENETFENIVNEYGKGSKEKYISPAEKLMYDLVSLLEFEKKFKRETKKGYTFMLHMDFRPRDENGNLRYDVPVPYPSESMGYGTSEKDIEKFLEEGKPVQHTVFRSLEDFKIA